MRRGPASAVLAVLALLACSAEPPAEPGAEEGGGDVTTAPDFTLPDLEGREWTLAELRGKRVLLDFWATWCPPCEFQIPILNEIYAAHREHGVEVLGIAIDAEGLEVVKPYAEKHGAGYPILIGDEGLAREFGAPGFPVLVAVAPDGSIAEMHVGIVETEEVEAILAKLAGEEPAPVPAAAQEPAPAGPAGSPDPS